MASAVTEQHGAASGAAPAGGASKIVAGFWRRVAADIIDVIALAAIGWGIGYPFRYALSELGSRAVWIGLAISLLYAVALQTRLGRGQTLGKRALRIQVLRRDGNYLSPGRSFLRSLVVSFVFYNGIYGSILGSASPRVAEVVGAVFLVAVFWLFFACFLMIPVHPLRRGLHDIVSGSIVVHTGRYDAAALERMEDVPRTQRAFAATGVLAILALGAAFLSIWRIERRVDLTRLGTLGDELAKEYRVVNIRDATFNGAHRTLMVEVWVPLRLQEDDTERERVRNTILRRTRATLPGFEDFEQVRVVILSGFQLGIAHMKTRR
jgi:uncharacterized RDD family membrane protein YckC